MCMQTRKKLINYLYNENDKRFRIHIQDMDMPIRGETISTPAFEIGDLWEAVSILRKSTKYYISIKEPVILVLSVKMYHTHY